MDLDAKVLDSGTLPDKDSPTEKISVNTIKDSRMDVIYISQRVA